MVNTNASSHRDGIILGWIIVALVVATVAALVVAGLTRPSAEKGYVQPVSQTVSWLIVQEQTLDRQLANRALLERQRADTVERACTMIPSLSKPSPTVATFAAEHCGPNPEGER